MGCGLTIEKVNCELQRNISAVEALQDAGVGSVLSASVASGDANALVDDTAETIATLALTEGTWLVSGAVFLVLTGASTTIKQGSISETTNVLGPDTRLNENDIPTTTLSGTITLPVPSFVIVVPAGGDTLYLIAKATFSAGSVAAFGHINATKLAA
jgi:hypothetical protein